MDVDVAGDKAKQSREIWGNWPLTTSPVGSRIAREGLELPSH